MLLGKQESTASFFLPESRVTLGIFDPHIAPARGAENSPRFVVALDVDKMLLNNGLAFGHICLKGLHHPSRNIKVQEVSEADLHISLNHSKVIGVNKQEFIGKRLRHL